jgi:hypothetical protein
MRSFWGANGMEDFEKLGQFYLGKRHNPSTDQLEEGLIMYDSRDLVTHGVCVGMTGSGKTGLCVALLEEAAIDNIPALVIDPKGDMANLLLTFPNLSIAEFLPWINADEAARAGQSSEQYAAGQAEIWRKGLEQWGQGGQRILKLRDSADFTIYTPGSTSGVPVSVLHSFVCPETAVLEDQEAMADLITSATGSLLGLIGVTGDPLSSREHILIANIMQHAWKKGQDADIASLIRFIQTPPFERVGAFPTDSFFPAKERFELAMKLNNLLAAPGFGAWLEGEPMDVGRFLHTAEGRPRISIFSIAHLSDAERMFFVTLLLNQVVVWMRAQPGTTSLRAVVYMDEVAGYVPPVANPPSKKPLMLLLKQARAFGVGILLATQNPVDLDYKALSNAGTWFLGRLQTPQDIDRLVDGLGSNSVGWGDELRRSIASLGKRVFLMKNIHESATEVFQVRWCLSYLRGPLTLAQIKLLTAAKKMSFRTAAAVLAQPSLSSSIDALATGRPSLPPEIPEFFLPFRSASPPGARPIYVPRVCALGDVHYGGAPSRRQLYMAEIGGDAISINWDESQPGGFDEREIEREPAAQAEFATLAASACKPENYRIWSRDFADFLYRTATMNLYHSPEFGLGSNPGESESDFRIRVSQLAREKRDQTAETLRARYGQKIALLMDRIRRAEQRVEKEKADVRRAGLQTAVSLGATLLGAFLGRKALSTGTIGRASTTMRSGMRTAKEQSDIAAVTEDLDDLRRQKAELESEFNAELMALEGSTDPLRQTVETVALRPKKTDVAVRFTALVWLPHWRTPEGSTRPAYR